MYKLSKKELNYALFGLVFGDGNYRNGSIYIHHTTKQRFYIEFLETFCKIHGLPYSIRYDFMKTTTFGSKEYSMIRIKVPNRHHFEKFNRFFVNDRKVMSEYILNRITPLGLLFWYLDDGCFTVSMKGTSCKRIGYLNTQGFSYDDNVLLQDMLKRRFDIKVGIHKDNSGLISNKVYYRIYLNATAMKSFIDVVRPYLKDIPKEFTYKFNMKYTPNKLIDSQHNSENYNF